MQMENISTFSKVFLKREPAVEATSQEVKQWNKLYNKLREAVASEEVKGCYKIRYQER